MKSLARCTLALGLLTPALPAHAAVPADGCDGWTLAGYRIGMTRDEALAIHGGELNEKRSQLRPKIDGGGTAVVEFNADGKIDQVWVTTDRPGAEIKLTVSMRVGTPLADNGPQAPESGIDRQARWESEHCGADLVMNVKNAPAGTQGATDGRVVLTPHGVKPREPR